MLNVGINGKMKNEGTGPAESFKTGERKRGVNGRKKQRNPPQKSLSLCHKIFKEICSSYIYKLLDVLPVFRGFERSFWFMHSLKRYSN